VLPPGWRIVRGGIDTVDKHAETEARTWEDVEAALGGRPGGGKHCPSTVVALFRVASAQARGEPPTEEAQRWLNHCDSCSVCRRTYQAALAAARHEPPEARKPSALLGEAIDKAFPGQLAHVPPGSLLEELADAARAPVLAAFAEGSVRCVVGQRVLLLLLEPARADSRWGKTCWVDFGGEPVEVSPGSSADNPIAWRRGAKARLRIQAGAQADEFELDWDGWGEQIQFLALAFYPVDQERAEQLLAEVEEQLGGPADPDPPSPRPRSGWNWENLLKMLRSKKKPKVREAFQQLWHMANERLHEALTTLTAFGPVDPAWIEDALQDTWSDVWRQVWIQRKDLPTDPSRWLLELAGAKLLEIIANRRAVPAKPAPAAEGPTGAAEPMPKPAAVPDRGGPGPEQVSRAETSQIVLKTWLGEVGDTYSLFC
jgi:hypothetical protein